MAAQAPQHEIPKGRLKRWLGQHPFRAVLRITAAVGGVWVVGSALAAVWPVPDRVAPTLPSADDPSSLAPLPRQPVTLMVVGVDANALNDPINRAAPPGPANADSLMLIRVQAQQPLQILQLPTELGVNFPGSTSMQPLASSYRLGGVALTADVVSRVLALPDGELSRYVVMPRQALRTLVSGLGDVDVRLDQSLTHTDQRQNYSINLQAGRQTLNGPQAEQLVRFRPNPLNDHERRLRQQWLLRAVHEQLQQPNAILMLPGLLRELTGQVDTDISQKEWLSLAAAALSTPQPPVISSLPLAPRAGDQPLRQLKAGIKTPLWPPKP